MIYGKCINDMPKGWYSKNNKLNYRIYHCWYNMITRCYSKKYHEKEPTYKECYVCDKWLKLSGFVEDISFIDNYEFWISHPNERIALDKDIKSGGTNKCYCLEECMFVKQKENTQQSNKTRNYSDMIGENNWNYGGLSEQHKQNISKAKKENGKSKGKNNPNSKRVAQYDLNGNLIKIWDCSSDVANFLNVKRQTLQYYLRNKSKSKEYKSYICKYYN